MNLFLLLTAMLSALAGVGRPVAARSVAVEASQVIVVARAVAPMAQRPVAKRPDGYVAPAVLQLDLRLTHDVARPAAPERRRE